MRNLAAAKLLVYPQISDLFKEFHASNNHLLLASPLHQLQHQLHFSTFPEMGEIVLPILAKVVSQSHISWIPLQ
jgi:hypothetical protein